MLQKSPKYLRNCFGYFEKHFLKSESAVATPWANFGKIGLLLILLSGNTATAADFGAKMVVDRPSKFIQPFIILCNVDYSVLKGGLKAESWSSLVEGDEGCIGPSVRLLFL